MIRCGRRLKATDVQRTSDSDLSIWDWASAFGRQNYGVYNCMGKISQVTPGGRTENTIVVDCNLSPRSVTIGNTIRNIVATIKAIIPYVEVTL